MEMNQDWQRLSEQRLTTIHEWRQAHPKATLREIEDEVHEPMSRLEARVVQATAQASSSREWSGASMQERPRCPICHTPLQARGKQVRRLQAAGGQEVTLSRSYGTCPVCGVGFFPPG